MHAFDYERPGSLADALALLAGDAEANVLAGGQTLIPTLRQRLAAPSRLVDLAGVPGLAGIEARQGMLAIGAMTRHADIVESPLVARHLPALAGLAAGIGDPLVRNRGTIGGSLANNDPAADLPAAVLALGGRLRTDRRTVAADDFFTGMFETALAPGEILVGIDLPLPRRAAYRKARNPASRYALAGVFVAEWEPGAAPETGGGTNSRVRVAVTGAAACVFRLPAFEAALDKDFSPAALEGLALDPEGFNEDLHASAAYRAALVAVMARRAVAAAGKDGSGTGMEGG